MSDVRSQDCRSRRARWKTGRGYFELAADCTGRNLFAQIEYCHSRTFSPPAGMAAGNAEKFAPHVRWFTDLQPCHSSTPLDTSPASFSATNCSTPFPSTASAGTPKNKKWFEWGVALDGEKFVWAKIQNRSRNSEFANCHPSSHLPSDLLAVLPDGYTVETSPAAENWWREAAEHFAARKTADD